MQWGDPGPFQCSPSQGTGAAAGQTHLCWTSRQSNLWQGRCRRTGRLQPGRAPASSRSPRSLLRPRLAANSQKPALAAALPRSHAPPGRGRAHLVPTCAHPVPNRAHPGPVRVHPGSNRAYPRRGRAHPVPTRAHPVPTRAHPGPVRAHPVPICAHPGPMRAHPVPIRAPPGPNRASPGPLRGSAQPGAAAAARRAPADGKTHPGEQPQPAPARNRSEHPPVRRKSRMESGSFGFSVP